MYGSDLFCLRCFEGPLYVMFRSLLIGIHLANRIGNGSHQHMYRATDFPQLRNRGRKNGIRTESLFCQNYHNLSFLNRKLHVNQPYSNQWIANCHFMHQSLCLHVKGSRKSTWMRATDCTRVSQS